MEIRQYFASKGWAIPQNEPSPAKRVFGCTILIGVLVFWFSFSLLCAAEYRLYPKCQRSKMVRAPGSNRGHQLGRLGFYR